MEMTYLGVILIFLVFIYILYRLNAEQEFKKEISGWRVGDLLILSNYSLIELLKKNNKKYATLMGWSKKHIYISCGDDIVRKYSYNVLDCNKSNLWRKNFLECEKVMGLKPGFSDEITDEHITNSKIDGKHIDLLTEIECQVYLQQALDSEDYDLAEKIRKQMEKYR